MTENKIRLGILDCDELAPELKPEYRCYSDMFATLLNGVSDVLDYRSYQVLEGELPERPEENEAYLITGSKTGVYDNEHWLPGLVDFIRETL